VSHLGERLSAFIDGELSHQQRERVLAHLANCAPCRGEAAALRMLKRRMHALGEATADTALTDRLIAVAGVAGPARLGRRLSLGGRRSVPGLRRRWPVRSLAVAGLTLAGFGVPAAALLAGGGQQDPGPSVSPPIDTFMVQHDISTGSAPGLSPASPAGPPSPSAVPASVPAVPASVPAVPAPAQGHPSSAGPSGSSMISMAGATAALTRVAAASTRVATAATNVTAAAGRARRTPHPAITAARAR
jgi:hypothetical protein